MVESPAANTVTLNTVSYQHPATGSNTRKVSSITVFCATTGAVKTKDVSEFGCCGTKRGSSVNVPCIVVSTAALSTPPPPPAKLSSKTISQSKR